MQTISAKQVFTGGRLLNDQVITIRNGVISSMVPLAETTLPEGTQAFDCLAPGFVDIHINGGEQFHFTHTPTTEAIADIEQASRSGGTAYVLPTCITSPWENILQAVEAVRNYQASHPGSGVLGMHLEGPFINPVKRGAHLEKFIRKLTVPDIEALIRHGRGIVRMVTIAPEYLQAEQIAMLQAAGIVVSAGHSNATYVQAQAAFGGGVRLATHLYNAMSAFGHREPGLTGAVLDNPDVYAPIILDGYHCHFAAARIAYRQKGEKLLLISDALFLNRKKEEFRWEEFDAVLTEGTYVNSEGNLAGGAAQLWEMVKNAVTEVGIPLEEAVDMVTRRPAAVLGISDRIGEIAAGYPAVFTRFDNALTDFGVVTYP